MRIMLQKLKPLCAALCWLALAFVGGAHAQDYPARSVRIVVPLAPGGGSDHIARLFASSFQDSKSRSVVVENRPGANTAIGAQLVARSEPDGYTLLLATPSVSTFRALNANPGVDALKDFAPVSQILFNPYMVAVNAGVPANNLRDFIAYAKANPGKLNYGALAGGQTLATEYFTQLAGLSIVRVQYKGEAPAVTALSANEVQFIFASAITLVPIINAGKARALAVSSIARTASMPDLPTVAEGGLTGFDVNVWLGILAPAGTPAEVRRVIGAEVASFVKKPEVLAAFQKLNYTARPSTPEELGALIASETKRWEEVARRAGIKPE